MKKILCLLFFLMPWMGFAAGNYQSGQAKSATCAACHGPFGVSSNPLWPNLAGQHAAYLIKQLQDFKTGGLRHADLMTPFAASLDEKDRADLALFYAKQQPTVSKTMKKREARGEQLYRVGDIEKKITACIACHGPAGTGNEEAGFPALTGQHARYAILQLQAFKDKTRQNDLNQIMQTISARMSTADMTAVADYLAALPALP